MKFDRQPAFHTRRDTWLEIDLSAFEHNVKTIQAAVSPETGIMAVIKADAYGHGAPMLVPILESLGITMIGVASIDEAIQIRQTPTQLPILVLGPSPDWALQEASSQQFHVSIFSPQHLETLQQHFLRSQKQTTVHIKVDTGMNRIGTDSQEAIAFIDAALNTDGVIVEGVFTHLAAADDPDITAKQLNEWQSVLDKLPEGIRWRHIASSAGIDAPQIQALGNMIRPGLALFGYGSLTESLNLKKVMSVKARVVHLQQVAPGEGVSYNHRFINQSTHPKTIAVLPLGYADGIPRGLSNDVHFIYKDTWVPQVGAICMDQLMVDVTDVEHPQVGDVVTLIGEQGGKSVWLDTWAEKRATIEYEIMTSLRIRLPRTYKRSAT